MKVIAGGSAYKLVTDREVCKRSGQIPKQRKVVNILNIQCTHRTRQLGIHDLNLRNKREYM
jgi:hypothetical protein